MEDYFKSRISLKPVDSLKRIDKILIAKQLVSDVGSKLKLALLSLTSFIDITALEHFPSNRPNFALYEMRWRLILRV